MVPKEWEIKTIGDIATVSSGGTPSRKEQAYWNGDIPWVTTAEVQFKTILDSAEKITKEGLTNSSAKLFPINTILMAMYGQGKTRGQVAKLGIEASTNQACAAIILSSDYCVDYYYQFLIYQYENIRDMSNSGSQENLSGSIVKSIPVLVPPYFEQEKIAQILSTWDQAISATEKLIENSQKQKKALMQQLLTGKKRLFDGNGVSFSDTWKTYKLGQLFKERVEIGRDDLPLLSITADDGVVYQEETGRKNTSNEDKSKYRRICVNDIGYNTMRMWQGRSSLSDKDGIVSPAYTIIIPSEKIIPRFAAYLFKLPKLVHVFYRHSQGLVSDTWNLKFTHLKEISWSFPCVEEQQKIADVLFLADQEIAILQDKLDYLKQEKKALMQQLLTGKKRVKVVV